MTTQTPPLRAFLSKRLSDYETFMPDPEGEILEQACQGTTVQQAAEELFAAWRMVTYARNLPWQLATTIPNATKANVLHSPMAETALRIAAEGVKALSLDSKTEQAVLSVLQRVALRAQHGKEILRHTEPTAEELQHGWELLLEERALGFALHASESQAFSSLYFAYEHFLGRVVEALRQAWPGSTFKLRTWFEEELGSEAMERCWSHPHVAAARHARDAMVHRGGRAVASSEDELGGILDVHDGRIAIYAGDTNALYAVLRDNVIWLLRDERLQAEQREG